MKQNILFVDDEPNFLDGLRRQLREQRHMWDLNFAYSVAEAWDKLREQRFDAVVSDITMPGKTGFDLLENIRSADHTRDVPVIMLTGLNERSLKRRALDLGASDLLNKPVDPEDLVARLRSVLRLKSYQDELKVQNNILEQKVQERTKELADSRLDIIWRLAKAAEFRDEEMGNHVVRVGCYCRVLAESLGMDRNFVEMLFLSSPLHDIGKIGIPDSILLKQDRLTPSEWGLMKQHCVIGAEILRQDAKVMRAFVTWEKRNLEGKPHTENPLLKMASEIALTHHEWWDGKGYPQELSGEEIPLASRIVSIADVYDALGSARPYKPAYHESETLSIMKEEVGRHFDPEVYAAFERCIEQFRAIRTQLADVACPPWKREEANEENSFR
jgi:response regulator RpfG family c-di-GMP phosphodiesterase